MSNVKFYGKIRNVPGNKNNEISRKLVIRNDIRGIESLTGLTLKFSHPYIFAT